MSVVCAALCGLALIVMLTRDAIKAMCQQEVQTRLTQLPQAVLRLAVRCLPREWRADLGGEWLSELEAIRRESSAVPVTGLVRELLFAVSLLFRGRAVARGFAGSPTGLTAVWALLRRISISRIPSPVLHRGTQLNRRGSTLDALRISGRGTISIRLSVTMLMAAALASGGAYALSQVGPNSPGTVNIPIHVDLHAAAGFAASGQAIERPAEGGWSINLTVSHLRPLGPGQFYKLWYAEPGNRADHPELITLGTFMVGGSSTASFTMSMGSTPDPQKIQTMQITAEPGNRVVLFGERLT